MQVAGLPLVRPSLPESALIPAWPRSGTCAGFPRAWPETCFAQPRPPFNPVAPEAELRPSAAPGTGLAWFPVDA